MPSASTGLTAPWGPAGSSPQASASNATSDAQGLDALAAWVDELISRLGIPPRLRDLGVPEDRENEIVSRALEDHCHLTNPRPCGEREMRQLFQAAW